MQIRIPITEKQHDKASALIAAQTAARSQTETYCESILDGLASRPERAGLMGVEKQPDGACVMVLDVPEPVEAQT